HHRYLRNHSHCYCFFYILYFHYIRTSLYLARQISIQYGTRSKESTAKGRNAYSNKRCESSFQQIYLLSFHFEFAYRNHCFNPFRYLYLYRPLGGLPLKRYIFLISAVLFLSTFWINAPSVQAEMTSTKALEEHQQACQQMSNTQEKNWKTIMHFLNPKNTDTVQADTEKMKKHLNKNILPSQERLHAELDLEPFVNCPSIEENNTMLAGKTTAYYELLAYIEQIMEQEDSLKIDDLTFTQFRNDTYMQYIEASFTDGKTVEIKLFNSPDASADRYFYEHEEEKNQAEQMPDWMKFIYTQVIIPISKVIDNPLEKSANLYVNQQEAHKEKIREDNIEKVEDTARYLDADIALTEETHKVREETIQTQKVYINQRIYSMLERWEEV